MSSTARLAARSPRIVANGRTFAYLLHQGAVEMKITQNDVRAIQLAKAALYAGIALLMERLGIDHVDRIRLAGAFGSHIDVKYAIILGMVPDCDLAQVRSAGNAAGTGARIALLDANSRDVIEGLVRRIEKVETAIEPRFQQLFVEAMAIPHKTATYTHLRKVVELPPPKESTQPERDSRPPAAPHGSAAGRVVPAGLRRRPHGRNSRAALRLPRCNEATTVRSRSVDSHVHPTNGY